MRTEEILRKIDALPGMEDFKALCHRLHTASENVNRLHLERAPLPNLIFAAAPGCGVTLHIRLLADLLQSLRLLQFTGEEAFFEWSLDDDENAFNRFLLRVRRAAGFYGQFRGVIGLDLSRMLKNGDQLPDMDRLMEYIDARQGKIVFVLIVPDSVPERTIMKLLGQFASSTPAELIRMPFPALEAKNYIVDRLRQRGFTLTDKACTMLEEAVERLSESREFEGYQTLINLCDDIIWRRLSSEDMQDTSITEDSLDFIFAAGGFGSQLRANPTKTNPRRVGFGASMEE
ncbi:MAG: hypothetical protein IJE07_01510 [Clostridia bacterium]|nr:hypothetical protein [Clostridia bacterium]